MRPLTLILLVVALIVGSIVWTWGEPRYRRQRRWAKVCIWIVGFFSVLVFLGILAVSSDSGPANWADVADGIMPDGYARHSVETSVSAQQNWIVGEIKECSSLPLRDMEAYRLGKEPGYIAASINCDDGPMHTVTVNLYGRLSQPEDRIAYWRCTRESEGFTCRQTGAEQLIDSR